MSDPALTAELLVLANSAAYGGRSRVESIGDEDGAIRLRLHPAEHGFLLGRHKGTLSFPVDSEPGEGTTVRTFLPRVDELPEPAGEAGDALRQGQGESILVVEDEPVLRGLVQRMVESLGYRAVVAADGAEARTLVESNGVRPDLLLTDVVMPGMSGAALVEEIRRNVPDLKFVFMSGYPDSAIARHRIENATFGFLQKPFSMKDLASKLEAALHPAPAAGDRPAGGAE